MSGFRHFKAFLMASSGLLKSSFYSMPPPFTKSLDPPLCFGTIITDTAFCHANILYFFTICPYRSKKNMKARYFHKIKFFKHDILMLRKIGSKI